MVHIKKKKNLINSKKKKKKPNGVYIYQSKSPNSSHTPHVSMFVLYICVSVSALQTSSYVLYVNLYFILYSIFFCTHLILNHII